MKRFSFSVVAAMTAMALCAGVLPAQPRGNAPFERDRPQMRRNIAEELELTDAQKEQFQKIRLQAHKQRIEQRAKMQLARLELRELVQAANPDQKLIDAKITDISKLQETILRHRIATHMEMQKVLTPEQRKKAQELWPFHGLRDFDEFEGRPGRGMHRGMRMQGMRGMMLFED